MDAQHPLPDRLTAGGVTVRLIATARGMQVDVDDANLASLAYVLNAAFGDGLDDLTRAITRRSPVTNGEVSARPAVPTDADSPAAAAWVRAGGTGSDDSWFLATSLDTQPVLVPSTALSAFLDQLRQRRA
jgi:hypothetical protein